MNRYSWVVVMLCGAAIVAISMGIRQAFGIFLRPVSSDLGIGRDLFSLAFAIQNLCFGLALPFIGMLVDRVAVRSIIVLGSLLYAAGLLLTPVLLGAAGLIFTIGIVIGLAQGATSFVVVFGPLARVVPAAQRSLVFGIVTAGGSLGMFVFVPLAQALLAMMDWRGAFAVMAALAASMAVLALGMGGPRMLAAHTTTATEQLSLAATLQQAQCHSGYLLLNAGFFVCGFHVAFITAHLPAYLTDYNLSPTVAANALALIGLANVVGSYAFGALGGRYRKKQVLTWLYAARAVTFAVFLLVPLTSTSALLFGVAIGLLWLGTVPLTSGLIAQIFGTRYLSTLYGIVFLSHQVGAFLGAWLGGVAYDRTGSYTNVWLAAILLSLTAAVLHWLIRDEPLTATPRPAMRASTDA
ncbi:MAG: MFS transporter [Chloroflexaceae bacterium]|nr:MFS transporter [Chloroflexaceae bacterium]